MSKVRPLLIFDSGVGGLSVLRPIRALLPAAPIVYVADSAGYPYGNEERGADSRAGAGAAGRLAERLDPELIVIACNTASTIALDSVRAALDVPIVGTVPAIKPAAERSQSRVIGVSAPKRRYGSLTSTSAEQFASDCTVIRHGSAELVDLAEAKLRGEPADGDAYRRSLAGLLDQPGGDRIDTVVLACTHFLWSRRSLQQQPRARSPSSTARRDCPPTAYLTRDKSWPGAAPEGRALFTRWTAEMEAYRPGLARFGLERIESL
jgi:glutamate racemase